MAQETKANKTPSMTSPTLDDVARRANVSTATVSRCLNTPGKVSESTRNRVFSAVNELNYTPNFGARALAARRTNTIGAVIPTMDNAIFARGLQAFQEELSRQGITLLVASSSYQPELEEEQIRALVARGADALLLIGHDRPPHVYEFLESRNIPHAVAWVYENSAQRPSIGFDNKKSMKDLVSEALKLGHKTLGLISAPFDGNDRARRRRDGVWEAMDDAGLDRGLVKIIETHYSISNGSEAFSRLMSEDVPVTLVMCGNDVLAAGAISKARELGLSVPGDVSITGFDDLEIAEIVSPGITTIHVPHREMGRGAAEILVELCNGGTDIRSRELNATIMWRESLGAAPSK